MKKTPLYDQHIALHAKMVDFTGYSMPIWYSRIIDEHKWVRNSCGIFDVSHMAEFSVTGEGSIDFIDYLTTNRIRSMQDGKVMYTLLCRDDGGVIDDLLVYRLQENSYMIVANACNHDSVDEWFRERSSSFDVKIKDISDETAMIAIQGPKSESMMKKVGFTEHEILSYYTCSSITAGGALFLCSRTGYTGEDGFEVFGKGKEIASLWEKFIENSEECKPIGLGARDTLRLECTFSLYGHEISSAITPLEAGLSWAVDKTKDFTGKDKMIAKGRKRVIAGFEMCDKAIPRPEYSVLNAEGGKIGFVTSGSFLPSLGKNMGICLIEADHAVIDGEIDIEIRGLRKKARIVKRPFYVPVQRRRKE